MEHKSSRSIWVALIATLFCGMEPENTSWADPPSVHRPCVLLKNDNVLFGQAYQLGEFVMVRTSVGGEVKLPRQSIACWADSLQDLYQFRVDQRQAGDIRVHLSDVKWCIQHDLYGLAAKELAVVRRIAPHHHEVSVLGERLRRLLLPPTALDTHVASATPVVKVKQASFDGSALAPIDLATLQGFARHVQPMLINRCGRCHSRTTERAWSLTLPTVGARPSSQTTRENLAATLPFLQSESPETSELFVQGTTAHGGEAAPLDSRTAKAIKSLKTWLALAWRARKNQGTASDEKTLTPAHESPSLTAGPEAMPAVSERPPFHNAKAFDAVDETISETTPSDQPARLPQVSNPFDPEIFNRRFHMKTTGSD